jgi:biotin transport system substrate-specific component
MNIRTSTITASLHNERLLSQVGWIASFTALTAIGAQIQIPHAPVPYTLQTFFVLLAGGLLGKRNGALSQLLYVLLGVSGVPVFSTMGFGVARIIGPTGGYLLAFPVAAYLVGYLLSPNASFLRALLAMGVGLFVIFSLGTLQLNFLYFHDLRESVVNGFLIFSWWDVVKLVSAAAIVSGFKKRQ